MGALQAAVDRAVEEGEVPGMVAGTIDRDGRTEVVAAGSRRAGGQDAMTGDTVFELLSMTKAVTSVAALQLVETGQLGLHEAAQKVVPELADVLVLDGFDPNGSPILRRPRSPVLIRHLLTHTAGFGYEFLEPDLQRYQEAIGAPAATAGSDDALDASPLLADPGTGWRYGINTDHLGRVVERATGERIDSYFASRICEPLGMVDTTFVAEPAHLPRLAQVHARNPDGTTTVLDAPRPVDTSRPRGGAGLRSTVPDYLAFLRALLQEEDAGLLGSQGLRLAAEPAVSGPEVGAACSANATLSNDFAFLPGIEKGFSMGWLVNLHDVPGRRSAGSLTWAGLFNTYFWVDRAAGLAGTAMMQILPFMDRGALTAFDRVEAAAYEVHARRT